MPADNPQSRKLGRNLRFGPEPWPARSPEGRLCLTIKYMRLRKMLNLHGDFDLSFVQLRQIHVVQSASELLDQDRVFGQVFYD